MTPHPWMDWTDEEEQERVRWVRRQVMWRRAWPWVLALAVATAGAVLAAHHFDVRVRPIWDGIAALRALWHALVAILGAIVSMWRWVVGWWTPYVPPTAPGTASWAEVAPQSRLVHALAAHWGHIVVVTAGILLSVAFLWAGRVFLAFWVFLGTILAATFGLPFAQAVIGGIGHAATTVLSPFQSGGYSGY